MEKLQAIHQKQSCLKMAAGKKMHTSPPSGYALARTDSNVSSLRQPAGLALA